MLNSEVEWERLQSGKDLSVLPSIDLPWKIFFAELAKNSATVGGILLHHVPSYVIPLLMWRSASGWFAQSRARMCSDVVRHGQTMSDGWSAHEQTPSSVVEREAHSQTNEHAAMQHAGE